MLDRTLKVLGVVWSAIAFVAGAAFVFGGEWQEWKDVKAFVKQHKENLLTHATGNIDTSGFVRVGEKVQLRSNHGYLVPTRSSRPEVQVILGDPVPWQIERNEPGR